jgi:hypothetical protein
MVVSVELNVYYAVTCHGRLAFPPVDDAIELRFMYLTPQQHYDATLRLEQHILSIEPVHYVYWY